MTILIERRPSDLSLPLIERIIQSRGLTTAALDFGLNGMLDFSSLKGIDRAVELLGHAIRHKQRILIIGDFDVDGATSTSLAVECLHKMGADWVHYLVPNRFEFGYGLSEPIVQLAYEEYRPDILVTVDNGISSYEGIERAHALGMKVVVTDHHLPASDNPAELPDADAIVNPSQPGCEFPSKAACGCGVIFYVMCALRRYLLEQKMLFPTNAPNMAQYLDLVALATVADVVPLDDNNRILVEQGLRRIRKGHARPGILALLNVAKKTPERLTSKDFGFALGPRLNAAGRMDDMSIGIECLLAQSQARADQIAQTLDELNQDRKNVEAGMQQEALAQLSSIQLNEQSLPSALVLFNANWHQGVVGLLASRIKERYFRPVIAFAPNEDGTELKGSGRSIPGFHMRDALDLVAKRIPHVLSKFGGHAMAAGLSIAPEHLSVFQTTFEEIAQSLVHADMLTHTVVTDGAPSAQEYDTTLAHQLRVCAPWGQQFPEPLFDATFEIINQRIVGERHLKMTLRETEHRTVVDAIAFNIDTRAWPNKDNPNIHIVFELDANFFRNEWRLQLLVKHIQLC